MKIAIIGAGAMGCLYGGKLSAVEGNQVVLLDVWKDHVDAINKEGLWMEEGDKLLNYNSISASTDATTVGEVDLAIIFVKSTLTAQAVANNQGVFGKHTLALTLQNGLGNIESIATIIPTEQIIAGTTAHGATMLGAGKMRHAGVGKTIIGELSGEMSERIQGVAKVFAEAGLEIEISKNVLGLIWDKLLVNVGINALTAMTHLTNGEILAHPELETLLERAVTEAAGVAQGKGIVLSFSDPVAHTKEVCKATSANKSSMLQDILNHKQTEINMINGAVVREGKSLGIATPVNETLTNLITFFEKKQ